MSAPEATIEAVVFDLDDTLYPLAAFVAQAGAVQATVATTLGIDAARWRAALKVVDAAAERSLAPVRDALTYLGLDLGLASALEAPYEDFRPTSMSCYPGVFELLADLKSAQIGTGMLTNGLPERQYAKVAALGLTGRLDVIVVADEFGYPKPDPAGFLHVAAQLGTVPERTLYVGDRPEVDMAGALSAGMRAVRLMVGWHAAKPSPDGVLAEEASPVALWAVVRHLVGIS
jgi:putative hydrolase of the HAD superfamily